MLQASRVIDTGRDRGYIPPMAVSVATNCESSFGSYRVLTDGLCGSADQAKGVSFRRFYGPLRPSLPP